MSETTTEPKAQQGTFVLTQEIYDECTTHGKVDGITFTIARLAEKYGVNKNNLSYHYYNRKRGKGVTTEDNSPGAKDFHRYTEDELRLAKNMIAENRTIEDMAETLERKPGAVRNLVHRLKKEAKDLKSVKTTETRISLQEYLAKNNLIVGTPDPLPAPTMEEFMVGSSNFDVPIETYSLLDQSVDRIAADYDLAVEREAAKLMLLQSGTEIRIPVSVRFEDNQLIFTIQ